MAKISTHPLNKRIKPMFKQKGVVLIVSLVFLVALTAVASAIMQNTTSDMKMSGASQEKVVAIQEAFSGIDEAIFQQVRRINNRNAFALADAVYTDADQADLLTIDVKHGLDDGEVKINLANPNGVPVHCPPNRQGTSVNLMNCLVFRIETENKYGKKDNSQIVVHAGILQELPDQEN